MDIVIRSLILFFFAFPLPAFAVNSWVPKWVDGPATATYERTPTALRTYVNVPSAGGHVEYTLNSNPVKSWASGTPSGSSGSFGPASTATTPKISTNVKIPMGAGVGAAVTATLTAVVPKAALAKAAVALVRANPYVTTAITLGWLANAGYEYLKDDDSFTKPMPSTTSPLGNYSISQGSITGISGQGVCDAWTAAYFLNRPVTFSGVTCDSPSCNGACIVVNYSSSTTCPTGYYYSSGTCNLSSGTPPQTFTPNAVESDLISTPVSGNSDTSTAFDDQLSELVKNGYYPDTDGNTPTLTGPTTSVQGQKLTTVAPDGAVTTVNNTFTNTFTNNYIETSQQTTTTVTPATGSPTTTTTTQSPNTEATPKEQLTDCDKYPQSIGCSTYGDIPVAESLPVTVLPATFSYTSWGSGSCPASQTVHGITFNYTPYCEKFVMLKPVILVIGLIASLFIVIGPVRET